MRMMRISIWVCLLVLGLTLLPREASAASVIGTGAAVTVGTTATVLDDPSIDDQRYHRTLLVCVPEAAAGPIYVGSAQVTTSGGMPVHPGQCYSSQHARGARLYAMSDSTVQETGQDAYCSPV